MADMYSKNSPYYRTNIVGSYLDIANIPQIPAVINDKVFEVTAQYQYRPDLLAYDLYGDAGLWWVFAIRNKDTIKDPIYDLVAGISIYLPQPSTLNSVLGS